MKDNTFQKICWIQSRTNQQLLETYANSLLTNHYGSQDEQIRLAKYEILRRMGEPEEKLEKIFSQNS